VLRQGGKHRFYSHPRFPQLHESVSRQNDLPPGYAQSALKLIRELERLSAEQSKTEAAPATGPPATLALADLSILLAQPKERTPKAEPIAERTRSRVPPTAKAPAQRPAPPAITVQLAPSAPMAVETKPEPPPANTSPQKPAGLIERMRIAWVRLKRGRN
jgi:hypothetical protein